ncbi:electron transport complex subunit RsxC [Alteromonas stellipolaris]|uniref:Ion-translocating oxidoreductase complex subunit C n=1 Tax=Alteromonas stellipolaris TaxID=233316 RepID=A0AAW7Z577_9ALTE|nr:electron transport complex subunit RsxC [Alteromonas stellipolaris]MDO6578265.1 electron transport complex subunit RsxC [Alteromonas stellipolaris]
MNYPDFDNIIERLNSGKLFSFPGGVHPDDKKRLSNKAAIVQPTMPDLLTLPIRQHVGSEGICCVNVGDYVYKGQALSNATTPYAVPVHAPTSGHIVAIAPHVVAHPSGLTEMCVSIKPDDKDTWGELSPLADYTAVDKNTIVDAICQAGISGMGGAGFPTHIKTATSKPVEFLVLNGVECEPYITADDRLMREHAWQIRQGLDILAHIIEPKAIVIAVEDNKPEAIQALNIACQDKDAYRVVPIETKYPAGGEKQLIQVITGREVPRNGLPADIGVMMFNVGTCFAIADAILHGKPLIERIVTVTGDAVAKPANFRTLLGTPVKHLLDEANYQVKKQTSPKVIMGGPMMGFALADATIPVVKTTNCLLVPSKKELVDDNAERPCIRCSACADACPASLLPQQMFWHAKAKEYDKAEEYDLFDCIECGACAYVCPSEIPLVHYYRQAKSEIRLQRDEKNKAEKAKQRFEARNERLEREKEEREAKHRRAKEARLAAKSNANSGSTSTAPSTEQNSSKDKVAAALARAKAKKAALQSANSDETSVADAKPASPSTTASAGTSASSPADDKKAQVAAAIARAKAKKAQKLSESTADADLPESQTTAQVEQHAPERPIDTKSENTNTPADDKKAQVAAAIARAKAKKAARQLQGESSAEVVANESPLSQPKEDGSDTASSTQSQDEKKARVAAAIAKAKAKKAELQKQQKRGDLETSKTVSTDAGATIEPKADLINTQSEKPLDKPSSSADKVEKEANSETSINADDKKARIAAAVAKAKAKKRLAESQNTQADDVATANQNVEAEQQKATENAEPSAPTHEAKQSAPQSVTSEEANSPALEKKRRIAAAVAKAKAKKAAAESENNQS